MKTRLLFCFTALSLLGCGEYKSDKTKALEKQNALLKMYNEYLRDYDRFVTTGDTSGMHDVLELQYGKENLPILDSMRRADTAGK